MATNWKSQIGDGTYRLQFETDDVEKYKLVEKSAQLAVDGKTTTDVVEVVRCGKCKHYMVAPISGREFCTINAMKKNNEWYGLIATKNDHFCSYGGRRDT